MRERLVRRLRYLWTFELLNAVVIFPGLILTLWQSFQIGGFTVYTTAVVCGLLLVGAAFWYRMYCDVLRRTRTLARFGLLFRVLNSLFGALVLSIPVVLLIWMDTMHRDDRLVGGGMGVLALLEYLNYFHVQPSYDNRADVRHLLRQRRLKRGIIARTFGW
jgi:hypothetical protein